LKPWRSTFISNGAILGSGLVGGVLVARLLGAEDRGLLAAILYWPHFIVGIASMGLNEGIVIRTAKHGITNTLIATCFATSLVLALPVGFIGYCFMPWLLGESRQDYLLFSQIYFVMFLPFSFIAMNFIAIDQGEFNFNKFNTQRIIQAVTYPLFLLVLWLGGFLTVKHSAIAVLAGTAIVAVLRSWSVRSSLKTRPSKKEATELLAQSLPLHIVNIVMALSMQIDKMVLVLFSSNAELGFYVVAVTAAGAIPSLLVQTYINVMLPTAAHHGQGVKSIKEILFSLRKLIGMIVLSAIILILFMPYLILMVYGDQFVTAGDYGQVLVLAFSFVGIRQALVYLLRSWHSHRQAIYGEGLTVGILIIGAYMAVQWGGTMGLCILVLLAQAVGTVLVVYFFAKETGLVLKHQ
jgi:O-antigen/teichoic acid export membrane protein